MGVVGRTVLGLALCAGSARAGDIYRSTDAAGRTVYSNGPGTPSGSGARRHGGSNYRPETMSRVGRSPQMRPGDPGQRHAAAESRRGKLSRAPGYAAHAG